MKKNKYKQNAELEIDLHGYTTYETQDILNELVAERKYKHIRVITGRGLNSQDGPVLPDFVKNYFDIRGIRFSQSKPADGGDGALEVFL
jgi:DNA-nicking Smr family endonuclease